MRGVQAEECSIKAVFTAFHGFNFNAQPCAVWQGYNGAAMCRPCHGCRTFFKSRRKRQKNNRRERRKGFKPLPTHGRASLPMCKEWSVYV